MTLTTIAKQAEKFVSDNSPLILTAIGVTGTITTAYLSGKASFKAADILFYEEQRRENHNLRVGELDEPPLTSREKLDLTWREFIPAVGVGALTVTCIICANRIGTRRAAAMAAAYSMSEKAFTEYKDKIVEKLGENKERAARDEIAQDRVRTSPPASDIVVANGGDVLCYEMFTGRYFMSNMEQLKKAQNDVNYKVLHDNYASLSDFYDKVGLNRTTISEEMGWNLDDTLELTFTTVMSEDNRPCLAFDYKVMPIRGYFRVH